MIFTPIEISQLTIDDGCRKVTAYDRRRKDGRYMGVNYDG